MSLPTKDVVFLDRLDQLAKEGDRVRALAESVIARINEEDNKKYLDCLWDPEGEKRGDFPGRGPLGAATGRLEYPQYDRKSLLDLFWDSIRTIIAAQSNGFSLLSPSALNRILDTLPSDGERKADEQFWQRRGCPFEYARTFTLLSLYYILIPQSVVAETRSKEVIKDVIQSLIPELAKKAENAGLLWSVALLKLVRSLGSDLDWKDAALEAAATFEKGFRSTLRNLTQRLRDDLALSLQYGKAKPYQVADTVSVLGGRYLNATVQVEPSHAALYSKAAEYVLKGSDPLDGTWKLEPEADPSLDDPFAGPYSPLAFLLDLPNPILMPCIEALADTATIVLAALRRQLESYAASGLPSEGHKQLNDAVYNGLLIGASVADRLKDLLSDVVLDELKAEVPATAVAWKQLSNSLSFRENLDDGVIKLWTKRDKKRPGAILVFGPPGTGKTTIAKALLCQLNTELRRMPGGGPNEDWRFLALSPADFARSGSDRVIASAEELFRKLQRLRRCVVLLDEMEEFLRTRGSEVSRESRLITTAFLPLLQETVSKREIILIVATNFVGTIDSAVTRRGRFDLILPLGPPNGPSRAAIVEEMVDEERLPLDAEQQALIVKYTMGYTREEIRDFLGELKKELTDTAPENQSLVTQLWRIRQERVPIALSGNPGCNWRTFRDEATRFKRAAVPDKDDPEYWKEPNLP